jgi:antitoxin FitA
MLCTCVHVQNMSKMIQIRHVPERLHRKLKARAAAHGMPLSDYLRRELERVGEQFTPDELREALARLEPVTPKETAAAAVRAERDAR